MLEIVGDDSSAMSAAVSELLLLIDGAQTMLSQDNFMRHRIDQQTTWCSSCQQG